MFTPVAFAASLPLAFGEGENGGGEDTK